MKSYVFLSLAAVVVTEAHAQTASSDAGQRAFRTCIACHSLEPNRNMTGPSLAEIWGRRAGGLESFSRYSPALKNSKVIWTDATLHEWLKDPKAFIPGNHMTFPGIKDDKTRTDLLAFLKEAARSGAGSAQAERHDNAAGGMMAMGGSDPNLKSLGAEHRVETIRYCGDTYRVKTANGETREFWERNLRFKTDGSDKGPEPSAPAILDAGMMGDRASVIFAAPEDIPRFISREC